MRGEGVGAISGLLLKPLVRCSSSLGVRARWQGAQVRLASGRQLVDVAERRANGGPHCPIDRK